MLRKNRTSKHKLDDYFYHTEPEFDKCLFRYTRFFWDKRGLL